MKTIPVMPLTAAAFAPFGRVIEAKDASSTLINEGTTRRFHALASADPGEGGEAILSIFRTEARPQPVEIRMLERHPLGAQAFVPLSHRPWLVVVAMHPRASDCAAFYARGDQGVQFAAGTWHHPLLVLGARQDFLVVDRQGPNDEAGDNLQEHWFPADEICLLGEIPG